MNGNHLKYMLLAGAGLFAVLLATGTPVGNALLVAIALACPLMMVVMMMGGGHSGHSGHSGSGAGHDHGQTPDDAGHRDDPTRAHRHDA